MKTLDDLGLAPELGLDRGLRPKQQAEFLGISLSTQKRLDQAGKLGHYIQASERIRLRTVRQLRQIQQANLSTTHAEL